MAITKWKKDDRYDPWSELRALQNEINSLFDFERYPSTTGLFDRNDSPVMDLVEKEHEFFIACELPGIEQDEIDISVASNVLTLKGSKKVENASSGGSYLRKESWSGMFQRTMPLPKSVDVEQISAELQDGVLRITMPKKEESKPKQISVKVK